MGQFSWITQDTKEAIRESYGCKNKELTSAYMLDNKGNVWEEINYEGYGVFGDKDFYVLVAEMNGIKLTKEEVESHQFGKTYEEKYLDLMRGKGIDLAFENSPSGENPNALFPNLIRNNPKNINWKWVNKTPKSDPNQGWG